MSTAASSDTASPPKVATAAKEITAKVLRVVDGDTFEAQINGKKETVRMLLVDTPETVHPDKPKEPFGPEASAFTKATLEGQEVRLEKDVTERDRYGRLLYYVWLGDRMYNEMLLEKGLARVAVYPPDVKYVDRFREIQRQAQQAATGIWSLENYVTDKGYNDAYANQAATPKPTATSKAEQPAVQQAPKSDVYYANCTDAKSQGAVNIRRGEPGYRAALDRDNDGVACEK